jgi:transcriptional regulator
LGILGIEIRVDGVAAKFKYGGNVDEAHRRAVIERLRERGGPGDEAASIHAERRLQSGYDGSGPATT